MAKETIDNRLKNGPLAPRWQKLVAKSKEIEDLDGAKDMDKLLSGYDENLKEVTDARDRALVAFNKMSQGMNEAYKERNKALETHLKALTKLRDDKLAAAQKVLGELRKAAAALEKAHFSDFTPVLDEVSQQVDIEDNFADQLTEIGKDMADSAQTCATSLKLSYKDGESDIQSIQGTEKKLADDCDKADDAIRKTITGMQKQAIKQNKDKLAGVMDGFLKEL